MAANMANDRKVLIFGGSSGMGKAGAKAVVAAGFTAVLVSRNIEKLHAASAEILLATGAGADKVEIYAVDVLDETAVAAFFSRFLDGHFHHMINTVGSSARCSSILGEDGFKKLRLQFDLKLFPQLVTVSYGAVKLADGGSITLTTGALAKRAGKGSAALGCVNGALDLIVKGLANDLGPRLRINTVSPGLVETEMWDGIPEEARTKMLTGFGASIPCGRAGQPGDIGAAFLFLIQNGFISGSTIDVDGGASVRP